MGYLYGHPQNAIRVYGFDDTPAKNKEDSRRLLSKQDAAEKIWAINNLPSRYHPTIDDKGPYASDNTWRQHVMWRMACEEDHAIEYFKTPESVGIMMPAADIYNYSSRKLTRLPHAKIQLNMRDVGKYVSLEHNFRQHLTNYMKSDEGQQLASFLDGLGYKLEDIDFITIGFIPKKAIYGIGRLPNGKVVIKADKDSYKVIVDEAEHFGIEPEERREKAIAEEITHNFRKSYDKFVTISGMIREEEATKAMLRDFYKTLAETTSNPKLKAKYDRIIRQLDHDIATVGRYAKINSNSLEALVDLYCTDVGELVSVLEAKALYEGINSEEGINKYVSENLEKIAEAAENEYSEKDEVSGEDAEMAEYEAEYVDGECAEAEACAEASECSDGGDGE